MGRNKSVFHKSCGNLSLNNRRLYDLITLLTINRFKWSNLPNGVESRHIEKALFETGQVAFYEDNVYGLLVLPSSNDGTLNIYGDPTGYILTGVGYSKRVGRDDCVRILNNDLALGNIKQVLYYTEYLSDLEELMNDNLRQQRYPFIISTTKQNEFTMKNLLNKVMDGEDAIFVDERLSQGADLGIQVLNTNVPFLLEDLQKHKNAIVNEMLTWLGINNNLNQDKKERMIVDEVNVNNTHILMYLDIEYKNRLKACEEINKRYGLNIKVERTIDTLMIDALNSIKMNPQEEGDSNE